MTHKISNSLKEFGVQILEELDKTIYKPTSMLWTDSIKKGEWSLVIGITPVKQLEYLEAGEFKDLKLKVSEIIQHISTKDYSFELIVIPSEHEFLLNLGSVITTEDDTIADITLNNSSVNGINTGANHIYRLVVNKK